MLLLKVTTLLLIEVPLSEFQTFGIKKNLDLPTLNAHASDKIIQAIKQVGSGEAKVTSITITAEQGVGKTHIIRRLYHHLQTEGNTIVVYASASKLSNLDRIKHEFLQNWSKSLNQHGAEGVNHWQELATALVNRFSKNQASPREMVANKFPFALSKNPKLIDNLTTTVLKNNGNIDPDIIRAILWTLSEEHAPYAIKWLSANALSEAKAAELGLPNPEPHFTEAKAFEILLQTLSLLNEIKAVLICFDELEGTSLNEAGFTQAQVVAELVKDLFNSINVASNSRGVVLLTMMLPDTWSRKIKSLPGGILYRLSTATREPIALKHMEGETIVELVALWLKEFYKAKNLVPHHRIYPFDENKLRELNKEKPTVRQVLQWCAEHFTVTPPSPPPPLDTVEAAFTKELTVVEKSIKKLLDDKQPLADALRFSFSSLIGETIETVKVEGIEEVEPKNQNQDYIDFKLKGKANGKTVKIGVSVLQYSHARGVLAGLRRLTAYKNFGLSRGCLVRSKKISSKATQSQEILSQFLSSKFGKWVNPTTEDIKNILAIHAVYVSREGYNLSEKEVLDFIAQKKLAVENAVIREILSEPTGEIPSGLVE